MLLYVIRVLQDVEDCGQLHDMNVRRLLLFVFSGTSLGGNLRHLKLVIGAFLRLWRLLHLLCELLREEARDGRAERSLAELIEGASEILTLNHVQHLVGELALQTAHRERFFLRLKLLCNPAAQGVLEDHLNVSILCLLLLIRVNQVSGLVLLLLLSWLVLTALPSSCGLRGALRSLWCLTLRREEL